MLINTWSTLTIMSVGGSQSDLGLILALRIQIGIIGLWLLVGQQPISAPTHFLLFFFGNLLWKRIVSLAFAREILFLTWHLSTAVCMNLRDWSVTQTGEHSRWRTVWLAECVHGGQEEKAGEKMPALEYVQTKTSVYFMQTKCRERKPAMSRLRETLPRTTKAVPAMRDSLQNSENQGLQREH